MIRISPGKSMTLNQVSEDQLSFTEPSWDRWKDSRQFLLNTWVVNGHSGFPHVRLLSAQFLTRRWTTVRASNCTCTIKASLHNLTPLQDPSTRKLEMPSSLSGTTFLLLVKKRWLKVSLTSACVTTTQDMESGELTISLLTCIR